MRRKELYEKVTTYFQQAMPVVQTELHYENPFGLLVAVILSAQCTDRRVNMVTPRLLHDYPKTKAMSHATPEVIYDYISSISYHNNKPHHLMKINTMMNKE